MNVISPSDFTDRDNEKLKAIGYHVSDDFNGVSRQWFADRGYHGMPATICSSETEARGACKSHSQSPEGLKATMADKVRFISKALKEAGSETGNIELVDLGDTWEAEPVAEPTNEAAKCLGSGPSPEAAVDDLFWKVP